MNNSVVTPNQKISQFKAKSNIKLKLSKREYLKLYRKQNRDKIRTYNQQYYKTNREMIRMQQKQYYQTKTCQNSES